MTRSPAKRYEPIWRDRVIYWVFRVLDVVIFRRDDPVAPEYIKGPWCEKCGRWWLDGQPRSTGLLCRCGASDPIVLERQTRSWGLPPGAGALGVDMGILLAGMVVMSGMARKRPEWWKALGLESRPADEDEARRAYKRALGDAHPDRGGSRQQMEAVAKAWTHAERDYAHG